LFKMKKFQGVKSRHTAQTRSSLNHQQRSDTLASSKSTSSLSSRNGLSSVHTAWG
jgi:hypothetical protein